MVGVVHPDIVRAGVWRDAVHPGELDDGIGVGSPGKEPIP
jgi:hypothetical protein